MFTVCFTIKLIVLIAIVKYLNAFMKANFEIKLINPAKENEALMDI